jgi:hypothetical protein
MNARFPFRRWVVAAPLVAVLTALAGCLPFPVGDPAKATADSRLFGVWEWRDAHVNRAVIRPWDSHTYVIDVLTGDPTGDTGQTIAPKSRDVFKAWLADIKGQTFLTMQPIDTIGTVNGDDRQPSYIVARIKLEGTTLTIDAVDPQFKPLQDIKTQADLEQLIAANLGNPKLFTSPTIATRWTTDQMKGLEKLQDSFRNMK